MSLELKPCPFCGGKAYLDKASADLLDECSKNYVVRCWDCRVSTAWFDDEDKCKDMWNKREGCK